jgi:hypothetical protein
MSVVWEVQMELELEEKFLAAQKAKRKQEVARFNEFRPKPKASTVTALMRVGIAVLLLGFWVCVFNALVPLVRVK